MPDDQNGKGDDTRHDQPEGRPVETGAEIGADSASEAVAEKSKKKKKKNKPATNAATDAVTDGPAPLGTAKAVETMFRNAIRAEMDIIALAATKANIMISLNGFIISALMISGAFLFSSSPGFLLPAGVFLVTSAASIIFALLAASPERADMLGSLRDWAVAVWKREARLRDMRQFVLRSRGPAGGDDLNLLIYEDRVQLNREEYWQRMQELLRDRTEIYRTMSNQLYWLGEMANRKFKLLNVSYTVFRWGLLASVVTFFSVKSLFGLFPGLSGEPQVMLRNLGIAEFADIYEPSAVQQLPDGRLLVVEDEAERAISVTTIAEDGSLTEDSAADLRLTRGFGRKLSDLEGLTVDEEGFLYATTSHSLNNDGERKPDREHLLRFRINATSVGEISAYTGLRDALAEASELSDLIEAETGQKVDFSELNIEGLAYHEGTLLLGLREPMAGEQSLIVVIENPAEIFANKAPPRFGPPVLLDLSNGGIRALSFDRVLGTYLIVNEIEGHEGNRYSQLWRWSGDPKMPAEPVALPDIINLNNVESIDSITVHGEPRLMIMSDEGNAKKNQPAKYMMLDYGQLTQ